MKSKLHVMAGAGLLLAIFLLVAPQAINASRVCTAPAGLYSWISAIWTGGCSGSYSGHAVPGLGDDAIIPSGSTIAMAINSPTSPATPALNSLTVSGMLNMGDAATFANYGEVKVTGDIVINSGGMINTIYANNGTGHRTNFLRYGGTFTNNGTFTRFNSTGGTNQIDNAITILKKTGSTDTRPKPACPALPALCSSGWGSPTGRVRRGQWSG